MMRSGESGLQAQRSASSCEAPSILFGLHLYVGTNAATKNTSLIVINRHRRPAHWVGLINATVVALSE